LFRKTLHLKCGQSGCSHFFGTFSGLRKHLKAHEPCGDPGEGPSTPEDLDRSFVNDFLSNSAPSDPVLLNKSLVDSCAATVAELKVAGVGETIINTLVTSMEEIVDDIHNQAKESVKQCLSLQEPIKSEVECKIDQCFEQMENPFGALNSETKRRQYFTEKWGRVEPVECVLGTRFDTRRNRTTGTYDPAVVTDTFVYIPILKTLDFIYKHPKIKEMMQSHSSSREGLNDFCDGDFFKSHPLFSKQKHAI